MLTVPLDTGRIATAELASDLVFWAFLDCNWACNLAIWASNSSSDGLEFSLLDCFCFLVFFGLEEVAAARLVLDDVFVIVVELECWDWLSEIDDWLSEIEFGE